MARLLLLLAVLFASAAMAEDFERSAYVSATLAQAAAELHAEIGSERPSYWLDPAHHKYTAVVVYTGRSRPLDPGIGKMIGAWVMAMRHPDSYREMFKTEVEVREGKELYWVPIQESLLPPWRDEVSGGAHVEINVLMIGALERTPIFTVAGFTSGVKPPPLNSHKNAR